MCICCEPDGLLCTFEGVYSCGQSWLQQGSVGCCARQRVRLPESIATGLVVALRGFEV